MLMFGVWIAGGVALVRKTMVIADDMAVGLGI